MLTVIGEFCLANHSRCIRPCSCFRERIGTNITCSQTCEILLFLRFATMQRNGFGTESNMDTVHHCERWVNSGEFFNDDGFRNIIDRRTAVLFRDGDALKSEIEELLPLCRRRYLILIAMFNCRCEYTFSKIPYEFANHLLFIGFGIIHRRPKGAKTPTHLTRLSYLPETKICLRFIYNGVRAVLRMCNHGR